MGRTLHVTAMSPTELCNSESNSSPIASSSSDLTADAAPPSPSSSPPWSTDSSSHSPQLDSHGPLYELSSLVAQLPAVKRGLSKFFRGKSQSFTSLSDVRCIEELAKKETPYNRRKLMKPCKRYGGGLDLNSKAYYGLGPTGKTISKKSSSRSSMCFPACFKEKL